MSHLGGGQVLKPHLPGQAGHRLEAWGGGEGEEGGQGGRAGQALVVLVLVVADVEGRPQVRPLAALQPGVAPVGGGGVGGAHDVDVAAEVEGGGLAEQPVTVRPLPHPLVTGHELAEPADTGPI